MKGIIFAAGKGTRFAPLTDTIPKALIPVHGKPVIYYALDAITPFVDEVVVITGYHAQSLQDYLGSLYHNIPITYIPQGDMKGTAGALWSAKDYLKGQRFVVSHCDDIFFAHDIKKIMSYPYAMGVYPVTREKTIAKVLTVQSDIQGIFTGLKRPEPEDEYVNTATGVYMLDSTIFNETPVQLSSGEYGLPQTLEQFAQHSPIHTVQFSQWISVNSPEEKIRAEEILTELE